jgi:hypothetical protein
MNHNLEDDDFQFRPLTEGLGFQNKKETSTKASFQTAAAVTGTAAQQQAAYKKAQIPVATPSGLDLTTPLPRKGYGPTPETAPPPATNATTTVDEILKTLNEKRKFEFSENQRPRLNDVVDTETLYQNSSWEFAASMLDLMLVTAGTLLCLIVLLVITKIDLYANLSRPDSAGMVYISLACLVGAVSWIYLVTNRIFLGFTPGEWVFDQRLGRPIEHTEAIYALKAVVRTTLVVATGFFLFPLLSLIFKRDVLGRLLGQELVRKV